MKHTKDSYKVNQRKSYCYLEKMIDKTQELKEPPFLDHGLIQHTNYV